MTRKVDHKHLIAVALAVSFSLPMPALATKLNAKPLPRNGDPAGRASYNREEKTWGSDDEALPISRFRRRPDYRELEKQEAAEQEQKAKDALAAKKAAEAKKKESLKEQSAKAAQYKEQAVQLNNQAVAFGQKGQWAQAIDAHEKAVKYDPANKQFRINLSAARTAYGEHLMKQQQFDAAASNFRKALSAAHDNGAAGKLLAEALERMDLDPLDADVRLELGDQLLATGDYDGAYVEYQQAYHIEQNAKVCLKLGDIEYRYRRFDNALAWYKQAASKDPNFGAAYRQEGFIQLAKGDRTGAAASLRKAVILDSSDAAAGQALVEIWRKQVSANPMLAENHLGLAGALQLTGDFTGAESEYKRLELLDANHPGLGPGRASLGKAYQHAKAEKHKKAADTLFEQGLKREALAEISQAVMIEPRNAQYQFFMGECLEGVGDYKGAHQAYLTCVLIDPENNKEAAARMKAMQTGGTVNPAQSQPPLPHMQPQMPRQMPPMQQPPMHQQAPPQQMMQQARPPQQMMQQGNFTVPSQVGRNMYGGGQPMGGMQQPPPQQVMQAPQGQPAMTKNTFEGGPGMANAAMGGFRVHDDGAEQPVNMAMQPQGQPPQNNQFTNNSSGFRSIPTGHAGHPIADGRSSNDTVEAQTNSMAAVSNQVDSKFSAIIAKEQNRDYLGAAGMLRQMAAQDLENPAIHHRLAVNLMAAGQISEAVTEFRISSALKPEDKGYAADLARALSIHKRTVTASNGSNQEAESVDRSGGENQ